MDFLQGERAAAFGAAQIAQAVQLVAAAGAAAFHVHRRGGAAKQELSDGLGPGMTCRSGHLTDRAEQEQGGGRRGHVASVELPGYGEVVHHDPGEEDEGPQARQEGPTEVAPFTLPEGEEHIHYMYHANGERRGTRSGTETCEAPGRGKPWIRRA